MAVVIEQVDISDKDVLSKVNGLLRDTFCCDIADDKVATTTQTNSGYEPLYLAAISGDEIVGFNAFISHDLILNGSLINCYQSCWIATSAAHRGGGIFRSVVAASNEILRNRGAAFIFCFPNENSRPIMTQKFGFREIPSLKWQVPNIPFVRDQYVNGPECDVDTLGKNVVSQNGRQLVDLKRRIYGDDLVLIEEGDSYIWGVSRCRKKYGIDLRYFEIGGIYVADSRDVSRLFGCLYETVGGVNYFQLTASDGSPFNIFLNHLRPARTNDLIVFDLNLDTGNGTRFNFFGGVKDVF